MDLHLLSLYWWLYCKLLQTVCYPYSVATSDGSKTDCAPNIILLLAYAPAGLAEFVRDSCSPDFPNNIYQHLHLKRNSSSPPHVKNPRLKLSEN